MRKRAIIGILALLAVLVMPTASALENTTFYFVPQDGNAPGCGDTVVKLMAHAPYGINNEQLAINYSASCIKIVDVDFNPVWWLTGWNNTPACFGPGHDWIKVWKDPDEGPGEVWICDITIRCIDPECNYCKTHMNFTCGVDCSFCGFVTGNASGALPANGTDGTFTCGEEEPDQPDLIVESVSINPACKHYYFANEPNVLAVTVKNIGTAAAGASNASVSGASGTSVAAVGALNPGQSETVTITDTVARPAGEVVTTTADCYGEVTESDETNNASSIIDLDGNNHVINHGFKGKWLAEGYAGPDPGNMTTWKSYELRGNLNYSVGDSYYLSGYTPWEHYTASWTADDLPISSGATVVEARLYVYYTWDKAFVMPDNVSTSFNGVNQDPYDVHYTDRRGYGSMGSYNLPYGALVYNVTDDFDTSGNHANVTKLCTLTNQVSMRGMMLAVVYEDPTEPLRQIFVTEEFDNLVGSASYCTTPDEATARALFTGPSIDMGTMVNANLITVVNGASSNEGDLIFNGQVWTDVWNFAGTTELGIDERDVKDNLTDTDNAVGMQSTDGDWMEPSNAFLVVEYSEQTGTPGDVDGMPGVTTNDGRQIFMYLLHGSGKYPLADPWAADCDGLCDGITTNDGRQIFMNLLHGSGQYPLVGC